MGTSAAAKLLDQLSASTNSEEAPLKEAPTNRDDAQVATRMIRNSERPDPTRPTLLSYSTHPTHPTDLLDPPD